MLVHYRLKGKNCQVYLDLWIRYLKEKLHMENNPQMPSQPTPNQGQYPPPPYQGYPPSVPGYPQMPSQPTPNQGQYPSPPYQGYPPSAPDYPQMPPNPSYQQVPSQPNQGLALSPQPARLRRVLRRSRGLRQMLVGGILVVGGILASVISYSFASSAAQSGSTGYYTIFTGAIVIGAIYNIVGFFRWIMGR